MTGDSTSSARATAYPARIDPFAERLEPGRAVDSYVSACPYRRTGSNSPGHALARAEIRLAAVRGGPFGRLVQKALDLRQDLRRKMAARLGDLQHVPPGRETVQLDPELAHQLAAVGEDVVVEQHKTVLHVRAGGAQRLTEVDLAAPVGR